MNILLIDAQPDLQKETCENLSILGYTTEAVGTVDDAVNAVKRLQPGLIVFPCRPPFDATVLVTGLQKICPAAFYVAWAENPELAVVLQLLNNHHIYAFAQERPDLRTIMVWAAEAEKRSSNLQERESQHSRLALEYAKLKQAYDDLRGSK